MVFGPPMLMKTQAPLPPRKRRSIMKIDSHVRGNHSGRTETVVQRGGTAEGQSKSRSKGGQADY